jgi:LPXTG-motif cell wall-anchored protein
MKGAANQCRAFFLSFSIPQSFMADENNNGWLSDSLDALPGVLRGVSSIIYAEKGISNAPTTYVQAPAPLTGNNNMLFIGIGAIVLAVLLLVIMKK